MNKLTKVETLYVPVSVNDELPQKAGFYIVKRETSLYPNSLSNNSFHPKTGFEEFESFGYHVTHWLKEQNNKYILSEEDIENIICKAVELAREGIVVHRISEWETEKEFDYNDSEIIKQILNNE